MLHSEPLPITVANAAPKMAALGWLSRTPPSETVNSVSMVVSSRAMIFDPMPVTITVPPLSIVVSSRPPLVTISVPATMV